MKKIISITIFLFAATILSAQTDSLQVKTNVSKNDTDSLAGKSYNNVLPSFPGDEGAFLHYLTMNIHYPAAEMKAKKQGTVYVAFTVEKDGTITDVHAVKEVPDAPGLTAEAIRVISAMPKWNPCLINGIPARVLMTYPVKFVLN